MEELVSNVSISMTPVAHAGASPAGIAWAPWIEALLSCAAIVVLLPLFDLLAANPMGRDDRFAVNAAASALLAVAGEAMPGNPDPAELLDVDVHQLAGPRALVALSRLEAEPPEPAHPDPGQDA